MQFTINIDEKMFNESNIGETIKKSFESMSQEEKSSVMKDILKQYLLDSEFVKNYFVEKKADRWYGSSNFKDYPTENFMKLIQKIDFTEEMEEVKKVFIEVIEKDLSRELLKLLVDSYVNTIANTLFNSSSDFTSELNARMYATFNEGINKLRNNN